MNWEYEHIKLQWTSFERWILRSGGLRLIVVHYLNVEKPYCEWYVTIEGCEVGRGFYTSPDDAKATAVDVARRLLTEMLSGLEGARQEDTQRYACRTRPY